MNYPKRIEEIRILFKLDKKTARDHDQAVNLLLDGRPYPVIQDGDKLNLSYSFECHYYGDVARKLNAVRSMLADRNLVVDVSLAELNHQESILISVVDELRALQREIAARGPVPLEFDQPRPKKTFFQRLFCR